MSSVNNPDPSLTKAPAQSPPLPSIPKPPTQEQESAKKVDHIEQEIFGGETHLLLQTSVPRESFRHQTNETPDVSVRQFIRIVVTSIKDHIRVLYNIIFKRAVGNTVAEYSLPPQITLKGKFEQLKLAETQLRTLQFNLDNQPVRPLPIPGKLPEVLTLTALKERIGELREEIEDLGNEQEKLLYYMQFDIKREPRKEIAHPSVSAMIEEKSSKLKLKESHLKTLEMNLANPGTRELPYAVERPNVLILSVLKQEIKTLKDEISALQKRLPDAILADAKDILGPLDTKATQPVENLENLLTTLFPIKLHPPSVHIDHSPLKEIAISRVKETPNHYISKISKDDLDSIDAAINLDQAVSEVEFQQADLKEKIEKLSARVEVTTGPMQQALQKDLDELKQNFSEVNQKAIMLKIQSIGHKFKATQLTEKQKLALSEEVVNLIASKMNGNQVTLKESFSLIFTAENLLHEKDLSDFDRELLEIAIEHLYNALPAPQISSKYQEFPILQDHQTRLKELYEKAELQKDDSSPLWEYILIILNKDLKNMDNILHLYEIHEPEEIKMLLPEEDPSHDLVMEKLIHLQDIDNEELEKNILSEPLQEKMVMYDILLDRTNLLKEVDRLIGERRSEVDHG